MKNEYPNLMCYQGLDPDFHKFAGITASEVKLIRESVANGGLASRVKVIGAEKRTLLLKTCHWMAELERVTPIYGARVVKFFKAHPRNQWIYIRPQSSKNTTKAMLFSRPGMEPTQGAEIPPWHVVMGNFDEECVRDKLTLSQEDHDKAAKNAVCGQRLNLRGAWSASGRECGTDDNPCAGFMRKDNGEHRTIFTDWRESNSLNQGLASSSRACQPPMFGGHNELMKKAIKKKTP